MTSSAPATDLKAAILEVALSGDFILKGETAALEDDLARIVGWTAVGTSSLFGAVLLLAMCTDGSEHAVEGVRLPTQAEAARVAAARSGWSSFGQIGETCDAVGWELRDWPDVSASVQDDAPRRRRAVIVRELSSAAVVTTLGVDAVVWDVSGSRTVDPLGELAVIFVRHDVLAAQLRAIRNHGQPVGTRFRHEQVGVNARVDDIVARHLRAQLPSIPKRRRDLRERGRLLCRAWQHLGARHIVDVDQGGGVELPAIPSSLATVLNEHDLHPHQSAGGWVIPIPTRLEAHSQLERQTSSVAAYDDETEGPRTDMAFSEDAR